MQNPLFLDPFQFGVKTLYIISIHLLDFEKHLQEIFKMLKALFSPIIAILFFTGCSATWSGVQKDTSNAVNWTKSKVNQGAAYVKEKTE